MVPWIGSTTAGAGVYRIHTSTAEIQYCEGLPFNLIWTARDETNGRD
jgi:hypothetical protein